MASSAVLGTAYGASLTFPALAAPALGAVRVGFADGVLTLVGDASRTVLVVGQTPEDLLTLNGIELRSGAGPYGWGM